MDLKLDDSLKVADRPGQAERVSDLGPGQRPDPARHRRAGAPRPDPRTARPARHLASSKKTRPRTRPPARRRGRRRPDPGGRSRLRRRRRRQAHRRPGPHVPDPDGRDPAARPRQGNLARQEDRSHPPLVPPQGPRMRLRPASGGRHPQAGPHAKNCRSTARSRSRQTEKLEKDMILKRMPHNLRTVEPLMEANIADFDTADRRERARRPRRPTCAGGSSCAARRRSRWSRS